MLRARTLRRRAAPTERVRLVRLGAAIALLVAVSLVAVPAKAQAHDLCRDLGDSFAFGVSSYGALRDWAPDAKAQYGADFHLLYVYVLAAGMDQPDDFENWYVRPFIEAAQQMDAIAVLTFYQLLHLGQAAGYTGNHEADIVAQALTDAAVMYEYFTNFIWLLQIAGSYDPPVVVHVEPDSWGFMMWAMGTEGNDDASSIPVMVEGSGHPDVAGYVNHAGGLGQALLALRNKYAPTVRLAWHASNFRVGTRPEVVTGFYSQMGSWDALVSEHPHFEADEATWWEPWDEARVDTNVAWLGAVTSSAAVPLLLWQEPIGSTDWHLLGDPTDRSLLSRLAEAGVAGVMFEHIAHNGEQDPDAIRAGGLLGTPPPAGHPAGGTAAEMRQRVAAYSSAPLVWPALSPCASGAAGGGSGAGSATGGSGAASGTGGSGAATGTGASVATAPASSDSDESGCGCKTATAGSARPPWWSLIALSWVLGRRRRRARRDDRLS